MFATTSHPVNRCQSHASPIDSLRFAFFFLAQVVLAQQPTPIFPYPKLTPGDAFEVTVQDLCVPGYTKKVRNVPAEMKREVYEEYGVTSHEPGDYEVDHLIPLELGGSNSIKNLWPESHRTSPWNAQVKEVFRYLVWVIAKLTDVWDGQIELTGAMVGYSSEVDEVFKSARHSFC